MKNKKYPKLGIYFSHYECFGHTAIVTAIGQVFKKRFPKGSLFFIQAGIKQPNAQIFKLGKVYHLPDVLSNRLNFRSITKGEMTNTEKRANKCIDILIHEKPDLLITEYFPLGHEENRFELISPLVKAKSLGATIWGVAGHPLVTAVADGWREKILKLYQRVIILSPEIEKNKISSLFALSQMKQKYLDLFKQQTRKICFAGYLLPQHNVIRNNSTLKRSQNKAIAQQVCRVTVVRGGGAYYPKIIADAILTGKILGNKYHLTIIAGPSTTSSEWKFFTEILRQNKIKNVDLFKAVRDYEQRIATCDVCVSVASYNTSCMLLKHRKKSVVIPFEGYDGPMTFVEQPARAKILKQYIGAKVLSIKDLTALKLAKAIEGAQRPRRMKNIPKDWFGGEEALNQAFEELFSQ